MSTLSPGSRNIAIYPGQTLRFSAEGAGVAVVDDVSYTLGNSAVAIGPFPSERMASVTAYRTLNYNVAPDGGALKTVVADAGGNLYTEAGEPVSSVSVASTSQVDTLFVQANQLYVHSGTGTLAAVNNNPVIKLPDAASTSLSCNPSLVADVGYEVFAWISGDAANGSNTPITMSCDLQISSAGSAIPGGASKFFGINTNATANVPNRQQLPLGMIKVSTGPNQILNIRLGRLGADSGDTFTGNVQIHAIEFAPVVAPVAATTDAGTLSATVFKTPYDGVSVLRGLAIYTPLWSTDAGILIAEPVTISSVQQSRVALLNKTTKAVLADVQIGTSAHDSIVGHRDSSVCKDSSGNYVVHGEVHHTTWIGKYGTDLASLSAIAAPAGAATACSYRRFFRNPYNGDIWMGMRGDSYVAGIYKWNPSTKVMDRRPSGAQIGGNGSTVGYYGMEVAFASATTVYATVEPIRVTSGGMSGYPRQNIGVIKSTDGGASWTGMDGRQLVLPMSPSGESDVAFPTFNNLHTAVAGRIGVSSDGAPVVVAAWKHPSETRRGLWSAKWDGARWVRRRMMAAPTNVDFSVGNPHLIYTQAGEIYVVAASSDDHDNGSSADGIPGALGGERVPENNTLYLFKSTDGLNWQRWAISGPVGGYGGAYLDPESIRLDNVIRLTPRRESDPASSEVWELPLV
jgi:hypothetical protein